MKDNTDNKGNTSSKLVVFLVILSIFSTIVIIILITILAMGYLDSQEDSINNNDYTNESNSNGVDQPSNRIEPTGGDNQQTEEIDESKLVEFAIDAKSGTIDYGYANGEVLVPADADYSTVTQRSGALAGVGKEFLVKGVNYELSITMHYETENATYIEPIKVTEDIVRFDANNYYPVADGVWTYTNDVSNQDCQSLGETRDAPCGNQTFKMGDSIVIIQCKVQKETVEALKICDEIVKSIKFE